MNITSLLKSFGISEYGIIDFEKVNIINSRLLPKSDIKSVLMLLVPYKNSGLKAHDGFNAGHFARCPDYHGYFSMLFEKLLPAITAEYGGDAFGFADHSPVSEKDAACKCGLGFIGKNSLLINRRYGSFVVIGTVLLTRHFAEHTVNANGSCGSCDMCIKACPNDALTDSFNTDNCLSALSQKKKKSDLERDILTKSKTVWGCDICQNVCPYNKNAESGTLDYFNKSFIASFSANLISEMDESSYKSYAFSYRERKVILENILTVSNNRGII